MSENTTSVAAEIGELVAKARQLTTHAQAIIDLGASPEAMAVIFSEVLLTGHPDVKVVIEGAVNTAIIQAGDVAQTVETVITQAVNDGLISSVTSSQLQQAIQDASAIGGIPLIKFLTTDDRIDLGEI